jgi:hypothetical protein
MQFDTTIARAVATVAAEDLGLVGIAFRSERKTVDKIVDRLRLHP